MNIKNNPVENDETRIDNENQVEINAQTSGKNASKNKSQSMDESANPKMSTAKKAALGGFGVIGGALGVMGISAFRPAPEIENPSVASGASAASQPLPEPESLEEIKLAHSPTDNMSFNEAFATARAEVGANGVFEWRGGIYGTYYADEWKNFSDEYKNQFSNYDWRGEFKDEPGTSATQPTTPSDNNSGDTTETFGEYEIKTDENGNEYILLTDACTGEEVRVSPEDLRYVVFDEQGDFLAVIGDNALAAIEENNNVDLGYMVLDEDGNFVDFVDYDNAANVTDFSDTNDDGDVVILNAGDNEPFYDGGIAMADIADGQDAVVIVNDDNEQYIANMADEQDAIMIANDDDGQYDIADVADEDIYNLDLAQQDAVVTDYQTEEITDLDDYINDASIDDFLA